MILITPEGWANGLSATICLFFACILGLGIIYQARKLKAKLLTYMGINIFLAGFFWLIPFLDFFTLLIAKDNLINPYNWMGIVNTMWFPLVFIISIYIGAELLVPRKKKFIVSIFLILGLIFELNIFINPSGTFAYHYGGGVDITGIYMETNCPANILTYVFEILGLIFCGFGYLYKSFKSKGVVRKKFLLLSIGYFLFLGFPSVGALLYRIDLKIPLSVTRFGMVSSFLFFYFGLKEEPIAREKKIPLKKEIKVTESLFRLYERPALITEEEVTFHRERKICLVCKGKVLRISYICPKCNALYCMNCTEELSNLENVCWVCDEPLDETKPFKPYKKEKIKIGAKLLKK